MRTALYCASPRATKSLISRPTGSTATLHVPGWKLLRSTWMSPSRVARKAGHSSKR